MHSKPTLNKNITAIKPSQLMAYGLLGLPLAMLGIPLYLYLPSYYHHQFGLSLTDIGLALLLARLLDVITDPLIGLLSDRYVAKIQRQWQIVAGFGLLLFGLDGLFFPAADQVSLWQLWSVNTFPYKESDFYLKALPSHVDAVQAAQAISNCSCCVVGHD